MKAAVMTGLKQIEFTQRPVPQPKAGEVLVKVRSVGVCGSDLHYFEHGKIGGYVVAFPFVLGHEAAGEVAALGEGVSSLNIGDRVTMEPGKTCGHCEYCRQGKYNLCPDVEFFATPPFDGTFCEYVAHPADLCFKLPDSVSCLEGALCEPLAVGFHAAMQAGARIGHSAVVLGCGCIGLCTIMALRAMGISRVYATDVIPARLAMAEKVGATLAINAANGDAAAKVIAETNGGADLVFETAGSKVATLQSVDMARRGGMVVLVGMAPDGVMPFNIGDFISKELTAKSVFRYRNMYPIALAAIENGLPIKDIVTDLFPFDQTPEAMLRCTENKAEIVKAAIEL